MLEGYSNFHETSVGYAAICYASFWGHVVLIKTVL